MTPFLELKTPEAHTQAFFYFALLNMITIADFLFGLFRFMFCDDAARRRQTGWMT